jgi:RecA-family ATPase
MVLSSTEKCDEPIGDMRTLEFQKNNYGPVSAKLAVRWQNGVFVPVDVAANQAERAQVTEDLYIEIIGTLLDQGENLSANKTASNYAVSIRRKIPVLSAGFLGP